MLRSDGHGEERRTVRYGSRSREDARRWDHAGHRGGQREFATARGVNSIKFSFAPSQLPVFLRPLHERPPASLGS